MRQTLTSGLPSQAPWTSAPVIPGGMLPAVLWSPKPLRLLRVASEHLVWLAQGASQSTDVWTVRIDEISRVAPRLVETFPTRLCEREWPDGEIETFEAMVEARSLVIADGQIYLQHPDGIARISLAGDAPTALGPAGHPLAFGEDRVVEDFAVIGSRVFCLGYLRAGADGPRTPFLAQVAPGVPKTLWEGPSATFWWNLQLVPGAEQLWFLLDTQLYLYRAGQVTALDRAPVLHRLLATPAGLFACDGLGNVMALDPETGALRYIVLHDGPGEVESMIRRWLPSGNLVAKLAGWQMQRFGGARDPSAGLAMLRLPEELECLAQGSLGIASIDEDLSRVASWLGDPELGQPDDVEWCERLRQRHRRMIDELIDLGDDSVLDALPALFDGPDFTDACDYLLATCTPTNTYTIEPIVALLQEHPHAPPSRALRRLVAEVSPTTHRLRWFAEALPYLCERDIELETVRAKLRLLAGLDLPLLGPPDWAPSLAAMLCALVHEPEAGRVILASALRHRISYTVEDAAALLVAIAAPWCVAMLEATQSTSPHRGIIDAALSWLGLRTAPVPPESHFEWTVETSRKSIEQLHELQRAALRLDGIDN